MTRHGNTLQAFGKAPPPKSLQRTTSAESALREATSGHAARPKRRHSTEHRPNHPHPQGTGLEDLLLTRISEQPGVQEDRPPSPAPTWASRMNGLAGSARAGVTGLLPRSMRPTSDRLPMTRQQSLHSDQQAAGRSGQGRPERRRSSGGDAARALPLNPPVSQPTPVRLRQERRGSGPAVTPPHMPRALRQSTRGPSPLHEGRGSDDGRASTTSTPSTPKLVDNAAYGPPAPPSRGDSAASQYRLPPDSPVTPDAVSRASSLRRFRSYREAHARARGPDHGARNQGYESGGVTWTGDDGVSEAQRPSPQHRRNLSSIFRTMSWQSLSSTASGSGDTPDATHR